jgi:hypothetical protein
MVPSNVTYHHGGYESTELSEQKLLEALQVQMAQLFILMNQLPEHLHTPLMRPFAPPTSSISNSTMRRYSSTAQQSPHTVNQQLLPL